MGCLLTMQCDESDLEEEQGGLLPVVSFSEVQNNKVSRVKVRGLSRDQSKRTTR